MMNDADVVAHVYRIKCGDDSLCGNAFLVAQNLLLTCRHVVNASKEHEKIYLRYQNRDIECELLAYDQPDFSTSSLALLKPAEELPMPGNRFCNHLGEIQDNLPLKTCGYRTYTIGNPSISEIKIIGNFQHEGTAEVRTQQITLSPAAKSYKGLSGSPVYFNNSLCGILNTELEMDYTAIEVYMFAGPPFMKCLEKCEQNALQEKHPTNIPSFVEQSAQICNATKVPDFTDDNTPVTESTAEIPPIESPNPSVEELPPEASEAELSLEERLAKACDDNLFGFGDIFSYHFRKIGTEKLCEFASGLVSAVTIVDNQKSAKCIKHSIQILEEVYPNTTQFMDVYSAALFSLFCYTYTDSLLRTRSMDRVLYAITEVSDESGNHFPERCLLSAMCYASQDNYAEAREYLNKANKVLQRNCNAPHSCHICIYLLLALLPGKSSHPIQLDSAINYLQTASKLSVSSEFVPLLAEVYRRLALYNSNNVEFDDVAEKAVNDVKAAFLLDLKCTPSEFGLSEDYRCLMSICDRAHQYYAHFPSKWIDFFDFVSKELEEIKKQSDTLSQIDRHFSWYLEHFKTYHLIRSGDYSNSTQLYVQEKYPERMLQDNEALATHLQICSANNQSLLKLTTIRCATRENFISLCRNYHQTFLDSCPDGFSVTQFDPIDPDIAPTQLLFSYCYLNSDRQPILVWQVFIWEI